MGEKMKVLAFLTASVAVFLLTAPCGAGERMSARERRKKVREKARKVEQKAVEAKSLSEILRDKARLVTESEGKAGKIRDRKLKPSRLEENLARRMRELYKLGKEKLSKEKNLAVLAEAEERKAKAEQAAQNRRNRLETKRKIDVTILLDW